jgi:branched-chain amino acid transport system permease protein
VHNILAFGVVGIILGCLYALTACGLVVTYQTSGIFNFAHGAMGMFMAFTYWQVSVGWGVPWPLALLIVLFVLAPLLGLALERLAIRPLYGASLGVTLAVTLGLLLFLLGAADAIWKPTITRRLPEVLPGREVQIAGVHVSYYEILVLVLSIVVAVALRVLFTRTRAGITMRAVVDDRDLTARSGANPVRSAQLSWALGASIAALASILIAPLQNFDQFNLTILVVIGYAAAVVGRLKNLPMTVAGAMALGLLQSYAVGYLPTRFLSDVSPVLPMALLFAALVVLRPARLEAVRLKLGRDHRTTGLMPSIGLGAAFVVASYVVAETLSAGNLRTFGFGIVLGIVMLSLVLLTGYGGQVALCQMTFAGFGAYAMGKWGGGGSIVGLIGAVAFPAAAGAVLALVVLRLRGIYLALSTLAFAYAMESLFFNHQLGYGGNLTVHRFIAHSQRAFLVEVTLVFALVAIGVLAVKRGSFGRRLAAMNDSSIACVSLGMDVTATKVAAFTIAAGIAGLGGAMYGGWQTIVGPQDFFMLQSLVLLLTLAVFGINVVFGATAAALYLAIAPIIERRSGIPNLTYLTIGLGAVFFVGRYPDGVAGLLSSAGQRARALRSRRGVVRDTVIAGEAVTTGFGEEVDVVNLAR